MALPLIPLFLVGSGVYTMVKAWAQGKVAGAPPKTAQPADDLSPGWVPAGDLAIPLLTSSAKPPPQPELPTIHTVNVPPQLRLNLLAAPAVPVAPSPAPARTTHLRGFGFLGDWGR